MQKIRTATSGREFDVVGWGGSTGFDRGGELRCYARSDRPYYPN